MTTTQGEVWGHMINTEPDTVTDDFTSFWRGTEKLLDVDLSSIDRTALSCF